ncbi:MAG: DUF167 domain-containing protein [Chlamydiae bacterium]|jgi:uncharacterized protein (TIGR00251 family)|nr:DUF167 domain-containing protein [Chlamydiota bacterium]
MLIKVKVTPGSREEKVTSDEEGFLKVKLRAPPEDGKANTALIEVLAKHFNLPKRCIIIQSGHTSRIKHVLIDSLEAVIKP